MARLLAQDPRSWSPADRVLLAASVLVPFGLVWAAIQASVLADPAVAPFLRRDVMRWALREQLVVFVGGWTAILIWALAVRRRRRQPVALTYAAGIAYGLGFGIPSYLIGNFDNPVTGIAATCGITAGVLLIERRPLMVGFWTLVGTVLATTIAEQAGLLPYAPALAAAPYADGRLSSWWLLHFGAPALAAFALIVAVVHWVVDRWREGEERLERTQVQLAHANDLVCRYVAPELAVRIVDGTLPETTGVHERRKLTVVFCDLAEFTTIADALDDAALATVLNDHLAAVTDLARRFGGVVDKFVGDQALVLFGTDGAPAREAAVRALRMAQALQARIAGLAESWRGAGVGRPLALRVGVNTGVVTLGNFGSAGRMDYTAIGRQVNVAARLQQRCTPGGILVSHPTWALVRDTVACRPHGEITVKGIRAPLRVHEVTAGYDGAIPPLPAPPAAPASAPPTILARWLGDPLAWRRLERVRVVASVIAPFAVYFFACLGWAVAFPAHAPYVDRRAAFATLGTILLLLAGTALVALRARTEERAGGDGAALARAALVFWNALFGLFSYAVGHVTNLFLSVVGIGALGGELILFESRLVRPGLVAFAAVVLGTLGAEQAGLVPYAPLLAQPPWADGRLSPFWLAGIVVPTLATYVALFTLFVYAVDRWHDREARLRQTTARLDRANLLIRRYVPTQLADPLLLDGAVAADGHERRAVTVCCTDIQDFAQTADDMEGEDLARLLDAYLSEMAAIAETHGGTIHKFVGDGLVVLFGAPVMRPEREQAEAAVRMALAMQRRVSELADRWLAEGVEHPFRVRIGIHTGPAVVGSFGSPGRRDYTVVGSAMDVAARLQRACSPGAVLVSADTHALLDAAAPWVARPTGEGAFAVAPPP